MPMLISCPFLVILFFPLPSCSLPCIFFPYSPPNMFFSPDLLARRDSGFGLLWLAATLGPKSTLRKLPKKSVLTADISQLCDLIVQPPEPLALRLSSNLMMGVTRVYKGCQVKQEMFLLDVGNCVTSLKKVVDDMRVSTADLLMAQTTARPSAVTLPTEGRDTLFLDFDAFVVGWDEQLGVKGPSMNNNDEDFDPSQAPNNTKKGRSRVVPENTENRRAEACTLREHHDHLFSNSYDTSFNRSGALDPSSSQVGALRSFDLDPEDNIFNMDVPMDFNLGDELARELGEEWAQPSHEANNIADFDTLDLNFSAGLEFSMDAFMQDDRKPQSHSLKRKVGEDNDIPQTPHSILSKPQQFSPTASFSHQLLTQEEEPIMPLQNITNLKQTTKPKRARLLLDARTELTDDELKIARAQYVQYQRNLRAEYNLKQQEKNLGKQIEEMIWGPPSGVLDPKLVDFWQENFKVQVEARTGVLEVQMPYDRPTKKRRTDNYDDAQHQGQVRESPIMNLDMGNQMNMGLPKFGENGSLRSSEEPGQGRQQSRAPSFIGDQLGLFDPSSQNGAEGSQKTSMFPWDNAGFPSSSSGNPGLPGSDYVSIDKVEIRMRGSSLGRLSRSREGSIVPSQISVAAGFSPGLGRSSQLLGEDYQFDVDANANQPSFTQDTTQQSESLITLEKNSYNFFEYTKMQQHSMSDVSQGLDFNVMAPKATSTRHVAAAAFYHCLALATKDLIRVKQENAFGPITIRIVGA